MADEKRPAIVDQHRQTFIMGMDLSDPNEDGTRTFLIDTNTPDKFLFYFPDWACDYLKEWLAGGVVVAKPGDIATVSATKERS